MVHKRKLETSLTRSSKRYCVTIDSLLRPCLGLPVTLSSPYPLFKDIAIDFLLTAISSSEAISTTKTITDSEAETSVPHSSTDYQP